MKNETQLKLEQLAYKRTTPFCYGCYIKAPTGVCPQCHSDDLMRELDGVGVEYGTWAISHILEAELASVDLEEAFEESIRQCYPETVQVGWMTFDTVELMKSQDPIGWGCALSEYESQEAAQGIITSLDGGTTYYWTHDLEEFLDQESP